MTVYNTRKLWVVCFDSFIETLSDNIKEAENYRKRKQKKYSNLKWEVMTLSDFVYYCYKEGCENGKTR